MAPLNKQQEYLLGRLPNRFDLTDQVVPDPRNISAARRLVAAYEERLSKVRVAKKKAYEKALRAAREAIYFKPADKALEIVKALEKEYDLKVS